MLTLLRRWLAQPIIEDSGIDRPFRLRRASVLLLAGGWGVFLGSCLIGLWLVGRNVPVVGWADVLRGVSVTAFAAVQWTKIAAETLGGALFFAGLFSVPLFDRRDGIAVWRMD